MDKAMAVASRLMTGRCYPYIYEIGYGSYEESEYWQYSHSKKFIEKELNRFVVDAMFAVLERFAGKHKNSGFTEHMHIAENGPKFAELMRHPEFHSYLEEQGFVRVEFTQRFGIFGWPACLDPDDWQGDSKDPERAAIAQELKDRCKIAGIYVEEFEIPRSEQDKKDDEDLIERLREKCTDTSEEEIQETVKKHRTYHRLSKKQKERNDGGTDAQV